MRDQLKKYLFPSFMVRIDEALLTKRPWLWATRLHRVAWYGILLIGLSFLFGMLVPVGFPATISAYIALTTFGIIAAQLVLFIYWIKGQDAYHVEKEHGVLYDKSGLREFGAYVAAGLIISTALFTFGSAMQARMQLNKQTLSHDALVLDLNSEIIRRDHNKETHLNFGSDITFGTEMHRTMWTFSDEIERYDIVPGSAEANQMMDRVRDTIQDESAVHTLVSRYSGERSISPLDADYRMYSRQANRTADTIIDLGFAPFASIFWLIVMASVIHTALFRFMFRQAGFKTMARFIGGIVLLFYPALIAIMLISGIISVIADDPEVGLFFTMSLMLGMILFLFIRTRAIRHMTEYKRGVAFRLYLMPLLLIATPYLIVGIEGLVTSQWNPGVHYGVYGNSWFHTHFMDEYAIEHVWSFYPLGWWILYVVQFAYLPFIPYLKRQHLRLNALPRH